MISAIVIGSGVAGLTAAVKLAAFADVTVVTKSTIAESNTRYAQGGVAAAMGPEDSAADHAADTLVAGAGLSDRHPVDVLTAEGPARIADLIDWGLEFDTTPAGELLRGLEGAHSAPRILHAGGDATGAAIERTLVDRVRDVGITVLENTFAVDLVLAGGSAGAGGDSNHPHVVGVEVLDGDRRLTLHADVVILASGGAGQVYSHTTNPEVATGDGVAIAWRAGAVLGDLEFYQFHPTALALPGSFLVSEAVRGEGAVLRDVNGRRFMPDFHSDAELAPRDVVARAISATMAAQGGVPVLLDATALGAEVLADRFPTITAVTRAAGLDWAADPVPVSPAAHYWMGGIVTDEDGRTSVAGLYAVGEVADTGVHGANRLASNSLLESLVFADRAVRAIEAYARDGMKSWPGVVLAEGAIAIPADPQSADPQSADPQSADPQSADPQSAASHEGAQNFTRDQLQSLMWSAAGLERSRVSLTEARQMLAGWYAESTTVHGCEDGNLLAVSRLIVTAALRREESRGAHFRSDHPHAKPGIARHLRVVPASPHIAVHGEPVPAGAGFEEIA